MWEELAKNDFKKLWFSKKEIEQIAFYVRYHMYPGELLSMWENKRKKEIVKFISTYWVRSLLNLCDITIWDRLGQYNPLQHSNIQWILDLKNEIATIYLEVGRITLKDLKINWKDIVKLLWYSWPKVGEVLNELLEFVLEDEKRNEKKILLEKAKQLI
jgi:tRNA nucleotidyltransferase (CCA-adding enzyme)